MRVSSYLELFAIPRFSNIGAQILGRVIGPLFGSLSFLECQNRLDGDGVVRDHHNILAARVATTPDRLVIDPVMIRVPQPGKEGLGVEAALAIDTEIDLPQIGADR